MSGLGRFYRGKCPCSDTLIHGDKDNLIPLEYSREVARRNHHAELAVVKGGVHECLVSHRREVVPILNAFLAKHVLG